MTGSRSHATLHLCGMSGAPSTCPLCRLAELIRAACGMGTDCGTRLLWGWEGCVTSDTARGSGHSITAPTLPPSPHPRLAHVEPLGTCQGHRAPGPCHCCYLLLWADWGAEGQTLPRGTLLGTGSVTTRSLAKPFGAVWPHSAFTRYLRSINL